MLKLGSSSHSSERSADVSSCRVVVTRDNYHLYSSEPEICQQSTYFDQGTYAADAAKTSITLPLLTVHCIAKKRKV